MSGNREQYITGLRALADLLETHADIPLPYHGHLVPMTIYRLGHDDSRDLAAEFARVFPGKLNKEIERDSFRLVGRLHGLDLQFVTYRSDVCERVVKGTRVVTREEPVVTETRTVTETVEDVEWVCTPLLAERTS